MNIWKACVVVPFLCNVSLIAQTGLEREIAETMMKQMVQLVSIGMRETDLGKMEFSHSGKPYVHQLSPIYALAYLYKTPHPLNPYYGKKEIRDEAIAYGNCIAGKKLILEWPFYALCQVYGLLRDELPEETRQLWRSYADHYIKTRGKRPYYYTAFNHESYSALAVLRAGQVFGNPDWERQGRGLMRQLVKVQTELGYFNEGPGHGPSLKYNQVQLSGMLLFADYAADEEVLKACKKLADFMIRHSFPDGSTMGTFDGRQSWYLGYFGTLCYGLDRWPTGKELNRRIFLSRKRWNMLDPQSPYYSLSDWYFYFGGWWLVDEYRSLMPEARSEPLPQDSNGYLCVESGPTFDGGATRQHGWMVALSAIEPVPGENIYRLERQSRLDLWHPKTGLIIGGGHNLTGAEVPLANFVLLTGYQGVDCDFGLLEGGEAEDKRAVYFPRNVKVSLTPEKQVLTESFGQGDLSLTVQPLDSKRLKIAYEYDVFSTEKLFVQLPLIVYYNSQVQVDGNRFDESSLKKVEREVLISNPFTGSKLRITMPAGGEARIRTPIEPIRWYQGDNAPQSYEPFYHIDLLSLKIAGPDGQGRGEFLLEILE